MPAPRCRPHSARRYRRGKRWCSPRPGKRASCRHRPSRACFAHWLEPPSFHLSFFSFFSIKSAPLVLVIVKFRTAGCCVSKVCVGALEAQEVRAPALALNELGVLEAELRADCEFRRVESAGAPIGRRLAAETEVFADYRRLFGRERLEAARIGGAVCNRPFALRRDDLARANGLLDRMRSAFARAIGLERGELGEGALELGDRDVMRGVVCMRASRL